MNNFESEIRCPECGEVRYASDGELDPRLLAGMKCAVCAYA